MREIHVTRQSFKASRAQDQFFEKKNNFRCGLAKGVYQILVCIVFRLAGGAGQTNKPATNLQGNKKYVDFDILSIIKNDVSFRHTRNMVLKYTIPFNTISLYK